MRTSDLTAKLADKTEMQAFDQRLCDYFAFVLLEPISLEGWAHLESLNVQITDLRRAAKASGNESLADGIEQMSFWLAKALDDDPGSAQRDLAVDRTYLFRGVDERGPLPPYEGFYSPAGESTIAAVNDAYRKAGVRPSNKERLDYLGQELAFVSVLMQKESAARLQNDGESAEAFRAMHVTFKADHLSTWVSSYCNAALPHAKTDYFKSFLKSLSTWLGGE